ERPIPVAMGRVNQSVARSAAGGKFITLFYAEIDYGGSVMRFCNAGHNYPLLRRKDGSIENLEKGGLLLGLFEDALYEMGEVEFRQGDALLLYSDGISEAFDSRGRQ